MLALASRRLTSDEARAAKYWTPPAKRRSLSALEQAEYDRLQCIPLNERTQAQALRYFQLVSYQGVAARVNNRERAQRSRRDREKREAHEQDIKAHYQGILAEDAAHHRAILAELGAL